MATRNSGRTPCRLDDFSVVELVAHLESGQPRRDRMVREAILASAGRILYLRRGRRDNGAAAGNLYVVCICIVPKRCGKYMNFPAWCAGCHGGPDRKYKILPAEARIAFSGPIRSRRGWPLSGARTSSTTN